MSHLFRALDGDDTDFIIRSPWLKIGHVTKRCWRTWFFICCLGLSAPIAACSQKQAPESTAESPGSTAPALPANVGRDQGTGNTAEQAVDETPTSPVGRPPMAEVEPEGTEVAPRVLGSRQALRNDGQVMIDRVVTIDDGWLVVFADQQGQKGGILAYTPVTGGEMEGISITIDPLKAGDALYIALHEDNGEKGVFEYPGPDRPLEYDDLPVEDQFRLDSQVTFPEIAVSDQEVLDDGVITISHVALHRPGWLALHLDYQGMPGQLAAFTPVQAGKSQTITLAVNWQEATSWLHAVLYEDGGVLGHFEDTSIDLPIRLGDLEITASFQAQFPPDVLVANQSVVNGSVIVDRAVSYGPGWLVVYYDEDGRIGKIIGQAKLEDGVNESITVPVIESAATPRLHIMLHQDTGEADQFEFPLADPMVLHQGVVPQPISFRTDAGNYVVTRDQPLSVDESVKVPLVVVDEDAWVVIYTDAEGELGELIGRTWLPAGLHHEIDVVVDPPLAAGILHAVLHVDAGEKGEFEFPDSYDIQFRRNSNVIQAPFSIVEE